MALERIGRMLVLAGFVGIFAAAAALARPEAQAGEGRLAPRVMQGTPDAGQVAEGSAAAIAHPAEAGVPILRVETVGGLVPPSDLVTQLPRFTLYGDGLVVFVGPFLDGDGLGALPNLRQLRLSEAGIQAVLGAARTADLIGQDRSFGNNEILDAGTVVFSIAAGGRVTTTAVYALGIEAGSTMPDDERARFAAASEFWALLRDLSSWLPAAAIVEPETAFAIQRLQVVSQPEASASRGVGPERVVVPWPLEPPLAAFGEPFAGIPSMFEQMFPFEDARCGIVSGSDTAALVSQLNQSGRDAVWESGGDRFVLYPRPLLPDETGCPPRPFGESGVGTPAA